METVNQKLLHANVSIDIVKKHYVYNIIWKQKLVQKISCKNVQIIIDGKSAECIYAKNVKKAYWVSVTVSCDEEHVYGTVYMVSEIACAFFELIWN